jgi:hypothetical protein
MLNEATIGCRSTSLAAYDTMPPLGADMLASRDLNRSSDQRIEERTWHFRRRVRVAEHPFNST